MRLSTRPNSRLALALIALALLAPAGSSSLGWAQQSDPGPAATAGADPAAATGQPATASTPAPRGEYGPAPRRTPEAATSGPIALGVRLIRGTVAAILLLVLAVILVGLALNLRAWARGDRDPA